MFSQENLPSAGILYATVYIIYNTLDLEVINIGTGFKGFWIAFLLAVLIGFMLGLMKIDDFNIKTALLFFTIWYVIIAIFSFILMNLGMFGSIIFGYIIFCPIMTVIGMFLREQAFPKD